MSLPVLQSLAQNIAEAYYRLEPFLRAAVRTFVRQHLDTFAENEDGTDKQVGVALDGTGRREGARGMCGAWLRCSASAVCRGTGAARGQHCTCAVVPCCCPQPPASLHLHGPMQFWISFYGLPDNDKLRALRSNKIGKLSQVRQASSDWSDSLGHAWKRRRLLRGLVWRARGCCAGTQYACRFCWASVAEPSTRGLLAPPSRQFVGTVTRTTDVRPELFTGTFRCMECMTGECGRQWSSSMRCTVTAAAGCWRQATMVLVSAAVSHLCLHRVLPCFVGCSGEGRGAAVQVHAARHLPQPHLRQQVRGQGPHGSGGSWQGRQLRPQHCSMNRIHACGSSWLAGWGKASAVAINAARWPLQAWPW